MGKIGDLWVKLGLKKQEFDKGMNDAEKKTEGFGSKMQKIKGIGLAVWGAIGGAVLKIGKDIVNSTNQMEDKWGMFVTKAKAGWNTFIKTLHNGEWQEFFTNFRKEVEAAASLKEVLDADTEIMNSIKIQKARMSEQLAQLEIDMRDQTKSYKDRAEAAKRYLNMVLPIYDKEIERAKLLKSSQYKAFFGGNASASNVNNKANLALWDMMLVEYGSLDPIIDGFTFNEIIDKILNPNRYITPFSENEVKHQQDLQYITELSSRLAQWVTDKFNRESGYSTTREMAEDWMVTLFKQYEKNRNGVETQALVDAVIGLEEAEAAYDRETKKVQSVLNAALKGMESETQLDIEALERLSDITSEAVVQFQELPDIIPDDWLERNREKIDEALAEVQRLQDIALQGNRAFSDAVAQSLSGATQAFVDCVMGIEGADASQVLMNLMQPFADMAQSLGELFVAEGIGIEIAKKTLQNPLKGGGALIAAGVGLIAIGSALTAGIQAIGRGASGGASTSYSGEGASAANTETYKTEMTIYVEGRISGKDIVLSGNNTLSSWRR